MIVSSAFALLISKERLTVKTGQAEREQRKKSSLHDDGAHFASLHPLSKLGSIF